MKSSKYSKKSKMLIYFATIIIVVLAFSIYIIDRYPVRSYMSRAKHLVIEKINDTKRGTPTLDFETSDDSNRFMFYIAGHVYGSSSASSTRIYPPFMNIFDQLAEIEDLKFGVLTGDTVSHPINECFENLVTDMKLTKKPYYIAPGNHDLGEDGELFESYFKDRYYSFVESNNLFIVLSPEDDWNIEDEQLLFLRKSISENIDVQNIFVFSHQLMWIDKEMDQFKHLVPNRQVAYIEQTPPNFWTQVLPSFDDYSGNVYFMSGDVGDRDNQSPLVYEKIDNYYFIASGMGGAIRDNIIITDINTLTGDVSFNVISLNYKNVSELGHLEDWEQ